MTWKMLSSSIKIKHNHLSSYFSYTIILGYQIMFKYIGLINSLWFVLL